MRSIFGRKNELHFLNNDYHQDKSSLIVGYGRRRVGKSFLFQSHLKKYPHFVIEGIEGEFSETQVKLFVQAMMKQFKLSKDECRGIIKWNQALDLLTRELKKQKQKIVLFFDEYQWMSSGRSQLTALLKKYWDNDWKSCSIQLILCGSISSFMIGKVIRSKALYGRIAKEMNILQLSPDEACQFFKNTKSEIEIMKYLCIFGGVPKYLDDLQQNLSFEQNLSHLFFDRNSSYVYEFEKVFYSQFRDHQFYEKIIRELMDGPQTLSQISKKLGMSSGGGLKSYLENLEKAQFIHSYSLLPQKKKSKVIQYRLIDPFLRFHFSFVIGNERLIQNSSDPWMTMNKLTSKKLDSFLGLAFENLGLLFPYYFAEKLGIENQMIQWGPVHLKDVQVDLLYLRNDQTIHLCEFKFGDTLLGPEIITEVQIRADKILKYYPNHSLKKALITTRPISKSLQASEYFDQILNVKKMFV